MNRRPDELPPEDDEADDAPDDYDADERPSRRLTYRGAAGDPLFGLLIAGAVSLGLAPTINSGGHDMRYTVVWGLLALFGVLSWLLGSGPRIEQDTPDNLAWGVAFGLILSIPLLAFGAGAMSETARLLFREMREGTLLAYLVFVMPVGETLFFRGVLQQNHRFWEVALYCTIFQFVLFFPLMNVRYYPLVVGVVMLMANTMYSYVRDRNGLAAAWLCQITVNLGLIFFPFTVG